MIFITIQTKEKSPHELALVGGFVPASCASIGLGNINFSTSEAKSQDDTFSMHSVGVELTQKFTPKKLSSELLSQSYSRIGLDSKSSRVSECGTFLEFAHEISADGVIAEVGKLHNANFCKDRLCPMCSWRRSYKIFAQVSQIMELIGNDYKFLFLTLTVPNCAPEKLSETISRLMRSWNSLIDYKAFKRAVKGFFRALEITRNKTIGEYHPHFHIVLAVSKSYGANKDYIKHDEWLNMWRKAYKDSSITQVDIRLAKSKSKETDSAVDSLSSAVAEIAKYAVKSSDYIIDNDEALTDKIVDELSSALYKRRLTAFGGVFKEAFEKLKLDDAAEGDLVHINETLNPSLAWLITRYGWSCGVYEMTDSFVQTPEERRQTE